MVRTPRPDRPGHRVRADPPADQQLRERDLSSVKHALALVALTSTAVADPTSGVDGALFRSSYDANGVFAVEGARLMPKRDLSLKMLVGYAQSPIDVAVPGIGDDSDDSILQYVATLDMAFGMTLTDR